jgi:NTF2 fold immunity protein
MTTRLTQFLSLFLLFALPVFAADAPLETRDERIAKVGMVPDAKTAVAIALAVFKPVFSAAIIKKQSPFHAELKNDVWIVYGTVIGKGGTAEAEISRIDGRIIRIGHGK